MIDSRKFVVSIPWKTDNSTYVTQTFLSTYLIPTKTTQVRRNSMALGWDSKSPCEHEEKNNFSCWPAFVKEPFRSILQIRSNCFFPVLQFEFSKHEMLGISKYSYASSKECDFPGWQRWKKRKPPLNNRQDLASSGKTQESKSLPVGTIRGGPFYFFKNRVERSLRPAFQTPVAIECRASLRTSKKLTFKK